MDIRWLGLWTKTLSKAPFHFLPEYRSPVLDQILVQVTQDGLEHLPSRIYSGQPSSDRLELPAWLESRRQ
jgi:hypothetical protein